MVKNLAGSSGDIRDTGSFPESGRSPTCSSTLAWKIPWTDEPDGLQSVGSQRVRHDRETEHSTVVTEEDKSRGG